MKTARPQLSKKQKAQREILRLTEKVADLNSRITCSKNIAEDSSSEDEMQPKVVISAKRYEQYKQLLD